MKLTPNPDPNPNPKPNLDIFLAEKCISFFCDMLSPISEAVCVAFSQDGAENAPKTYVTHKLRLHGKLVAHLIDAGAHVYVAGSANKMPSDVRKAIAECLVEYSTSTATLEEAEKRLRVMERKKQYLVEAWS